MGRPFVSVPRGSSQLVFALSGLIIRLERGATSFGAPQNGPKRAAQRMVGDRRCADVVSRNDLCREGFCCAFRAGCVASETFAAGELLEDLCCAKSRWITRERRVINDRRCEMVHLQVHVPGLSTTDGPLALDDDDWYSADATLASFPDLIFYFLDVLVRGEVCGGLGRW